MSRNKFCEGQINNIIIEKPKRCVENIVYGGFVGGIRPARVKRIRLECPVCHRRLWSSVAQHDAEIFHSLPPHKPKGWWKKKKDIKKHNEKIQRNFRRNGRNKSRRY